MDIKEFIEKFAEAVDDVDVNSLTPQTKFRDLEEWSSLAALSIIAMADEEFGAEISGNEIRNAETLTELFNLINSKA